MTLRNVLQRTLRDVTIEVRVRCFSSQAEQKSLAFVPFVVLRIRSFGKVEGKTGVHP